MSLASGTPRAGTKVELQHTPTEWLFEADPSYDQSQTTGTGRILLAANPNLALYAPYTNDSADNSLVLAAYSETNTDLLWTWPKGSSTFIKRTTHSQMVIHDDGGDAKAGNQIDLTLSTKQGANSARCWWQLV